MDQESVFSTISSYLWGPYVLIPLLLGTGLYLTIRLKGVQFRMLFPALRLVFRPGTDEGDAAGDISHYQALTTALAATVGVGNIVGVSTAIYYGGPGALFWMWVTGLVGMASKYSEGFLGVRFRKVDAKGQMSGGPQYYLQYAVKGIAGKILAIAFAIFAVVASFGIGNLTQGNAVAHQLESSFNFDVNFVGIFMAVCIGGVLLGGITSIGKVTAGFVPFMILLYVGAALVLLAINIQAIPAAVVTVFTDAFTGTAAVGGFFGSAFMLVLRYGVARGIFSNESGMGSAAIAAAAARTKHPVRQGLISMTQTFIDTIIVVTCTGLCIVVTGVWKEADRQEGGLTAAAFSVGLPGDQGHYIVAVALVFFAFSTILGWAYYGERCVERLFGVYAVLPYRAIFTLVVYVGAVMELKIVWDFADMANALMAIPNLIGLILAGGLIARETKAYLKQDPKLREDPKTLAEIDLYEI